MERNRRIAKAYARTPILTINGYDVGFDGHRIGLDGFENPMRDKRIQQIKEKIDDGIKIRMDENGDLLVRRLTNIDVFRIFGLNLKSLKKVEPNFKTCKIEPKKSVLLFDMKEFHQNLLNELKSPISNRRMLEQKCFSFVSFGSVSDHDLLDTPVWCIIINLVALETLIRLIPKSMNLLMFIYHLTLTRLLFTRQLFLFNITINYASWRKKSPVSTEQSDQ